MFTRSASQPRVDSRVVDHHVEPAEALHDGVDQPGDLGPIADVARQERGRRPQSGRGGLAFLQQDVGHDDRGAGGDEFLGDGLADAAGRARYNDDLPL